MADAPSQHKEMPNRMHIFILVQEEKQAPPKRKPRHSPKGKNEKQLSVRIYSEKC